MLSIYFGFQFDKVRSSVIVINYLGNFLQFAILPHFIIQCVIHVVPQVLHGVEHIGYIKLLHPVACFGFDVHPTVGVGKVDVDLT